MSQPTFEPIGPLRVNVPGVNAAGVTVEGASETIAMDIPYKDIIEVGIAIGKAIFGGGGAGGGGGGCITISATNPDGSTFKYQWCPPPPK